MKTLLMTTAAALSLTVMAGVAQAQQQPTTPPAQEDVTIWGDWGSAPYASSFADATSDAKFDFALEELDIPPEIRGQAKQLVRDNPNGTIAYLDPGERVDRMMSGGRTPHAMLNVQVQRIVLMQGVVRAAEVRVWRITYQGRVYELILPLRCFNWSVRIVVPPTPEENCKVIRVHVNEEGQALRYGLWGRFRPSRCFGIKRPGSSEIEPLPNRCPERTDCDFRDIVAILGRPVQTGGEAPLEPGVYEFWVSAEFADNPQNVAGFCLEEKDGDYTMGVGITAGDGHVRDGLGDYHDGVAEIFYEGRQPAGYRWQVVHWRFVHRVTR